MQSSTVTVPMPVLPDGWQAGYRVTAAQIGLDGSISWSTSVNGLLSDGTTVVTGAGTRKLDAPTIDLGDRIVVTQPGADDGFTANVVVLHDIQGLEIPETVTYLTSHTDHISLPPDFVAPGTYHLEVWVGDAYRRSADFVVGGSR